MDTKLSKICMTKENISLKNFSNMHCGGLCRFMCFPKNGHQLKKLIKFINKRNLLYYVLGNGSNTLFKDVYFDGIIINLRLLKQIKVYGRYVKTGAGVSLAKMNYILMKNSLSGFEWSYGIPGTVGGGIYMNAGAYNGEISNHIIYAKCLDVVTNKFAVLNKCAMQLSYRNSVFKYGRYIILKATFKFDKEDKRNIQDKQKQYLQLRKNCQPISSYNLGSIFKKVNGRSAGQIIDELGLKGYSIGGAYVSKLHANFIINDGTANSEDIINLIEFIKEKVKLKCNIDLEEEIKII